MPVSSRRGALVRHPLTDTATMTLLRFDNVCLDYGDQPLLTNANLALEAGERVCLIGRNGAGKSSTLRLIVGSAQPDSGEIVRQRGLRLCELKQQPTVDPAATVRDSVAAGLGSVRGLVDEFQTLSASASGAADLARLDTLQQRIESLDGWRLDQRVDQQLDALGLPAGARLAELSGGWRRRVALASVLVAKPDLLLLDEPTNHLDIQTIGWLEDTLLAWSGSVLFITHDRAFLKRLATRVLELDRGQLTSWPGDYDRYLVRKEKALEDEARANAAFDKRLAAEEVWIRQGIKARRTRNEGRVRALEQLRRERAARVERASEARISIGEGERSGRLVLRARRLTHGYGPAPLISDFSLTVQRGDRVGLIGNNGVGKTTLLRLLLGELAPDSGRVKLGTNLTVGYYDQLRNTLDPKRSVAWHVGQGSDHVTVNGRSRHIVSYLRDFLFSPQRAGSPVGALSGGEANRVVLARLFAQPSNLLVLDEPTNDLDVDTLEVLEERLMQYTGTLLLVSHDRAFLDNVVTSSVVFETGGIVREYVGGYSDWQRLGRQLARVEDPDAKATTAARPARTHEAPAPAAPAAPTPRKLSYKLQRELDALPAKIEAAEQALADCDAEIGAPGFYDGPYDAVQAKLAELAALNEALDTLTERWLELEDGG
ncbi:MAG: ATP-binding cassette domain-containing protein [Pseudomonadota bacterium]